MTLNPESFLPEVGATSWPSSPSFEFGGSWQAAPWDPGFKYNLLVYSGPLPVTSLFLPVGPSLQPSVVPPRFCAAPSPAPTPLKSPPHTHSAPPLSSLPPIFAVPKYVPPYSWSVWAPLCVCVWCLCVLSHFSRVQLFATFWIIVHHTPLSTEIF